MIRGGGLVAALLAMAAAGCAPGGGSGSGAPATQAPEPALEPFYAQQIDWGACDEGGTQGFECGTAEVPLDYADPEGETVAIALKRLPAEGEERGALFVNPGGPGGSGYDYAEAAHSAVGDAVREHYSVVGFDPRGVGRSDPIECLDTAAMDDYLGEDLQSEGGDADPAEVTDAGLADIEESHRSFAEGCEERGGDLAMNMGTESVARDLDVLRAAVGDEQLSYLGASYGTLIGATYADLFPERVGPMVLDGALAPDLTQLEASVEQARGFETALDAFLADCAGQSDCPLSSGGSAGASDEAAGAEQLEELFADAGRAPLATDDADGRELGRARAELGVLSALYSESSWPELRSALAAAQDGDGTPLLQLGDRLYERGDEDAYLNSTSALVAVNCSDAPSPRDAGAYRDAAAEAERDLPLFGASFAWSAMTCAYWPEEAVADQPDLTAEGAAPILVVGTTRDSATPYEWSERLADRLDSGVLLTRDGDGHTGYRMGDTCIDDAVESYLLDGTAPESDACT